MGVDAKKICYAGISGGGWVVAGASNILAKTNTSHMIKACFIHTAMLTDETRGLPENQMEEYEKLMGPYLSSVYTLLAKNYSS